jgi:MoaA/NifB/PqqE/SkfB family radical SAM enzyme
MRNSVRSAYDGQRDFSKKGFSSGCYAPFVSLYFNTLGDVIACCKNQTFVLGNVSREHLRDIWKGGKITALRKALANYRFETGCEFCEWQIQGGNYEGAYPWIFEEFAVQSMEPEWPAMIEFAGSNTCNFACIMCSGELSSVIRAREGLPPLAKVYSESFFQDLKEFLPHLRRAKFFGGEPFLSRECFRIWDMMIAEGLSIPSHITTNGSQYNAKVARVLDALPVSLSVSIDGATKDTVEKIRINVDYEELHKNLTRFIEYTHRRRTFFGLSYCLMRQNWHEFGDFLLFADNLKCPVFVNTVIEPSHCSLYTLHAEELARVVDEMTKQGRLLARKLARNANVWEDTLRTLRSNANKRQVDRLAKVKDAALDAWRNGPDDIRHNVTAARQLFNNGKYKEALEEVLKTPETHPQYYHALVLCAETRRALGDLDGADRDFERALKISHRRPEAFLNRAWLRIDQGRLQEGIEDAHRARELLKKGDQLEVHISEVFRALARRQEQMVRPAGLLTRLFQARKRNSV